MINILAHRGFWKTPAEKNTRLAFERALSLGFGIETDVRDVGGQLYIAHDPGENPSLTWSDFLALYAEYDHAGILAINIKADGLTAMVQGGLSRHPKIKAFVFDMSVPDALYYLKTTIKTFTRHSEYEPVPSFYNQAAGVWMDIFHEEWIRPNHIRDHLEKGKSVALVSPELHGRNHSDFWGMIKKEGFSEMENVLLCTDFPDQAKHFFYDTPRND
jgi:glycerophosphoryl diester phosphodiesterase